MAEDKNSPQISADERYKIAVLYKHWMAADGVNHRLRQSMNYTDETPSFPKNLEALAKRMSEMQVLQVYYALLYVVVEGYQEIKCSDEKVDALIGQEDFVNNLRRFRNAVFHYQAEPLGPKLLNFLVQDNSEVWIRDLKIALNEYFLRTLEVERVVEAIKAGENMLGNY